MNKAPAAPPPVFSILTPFDNDQGQEALLVQEARKHHSIRRRSQQSKKSILLMPAAPTNTQQQQQKQNQPHHHDESIVLSEDSFEQALLARQAVEGSSISAELKLVLNDAVQKGQAAIRNREMERALQLLEFIIVPTTTKTTTTSAGATATNATTNHQKEDTRQDEQVAVEEEAPLACSDTISSLGFDLSFDNHMNALSAAPPRDLDVLSISSLNEILDGPLTPEQQQQKQSAARFRMFSRFRSKRAAAVAANQGAVTTNTGVKNNANDDDDDHDDSTASPERFVTTVVVSDGTMVEDRTARNMQRIVEEVLLEGSREESLSTRTSVQQVTRKEETAATVNEDHQDAMDASQIMENLNETLLMEELNESTGEVSFLEYEATAAHDKEKMVGQQQRNTRSHSPLKRLLQLRASKNELVAEVSSTHKTEDAPNMIMEKSIEATEPAIDESLKEYVPPVSPSTTVVSATDDRYAPIETMPCVEYYDKDDTLNLESEDFITPDDRYAVPSDPCSFCESLFRTPAVLSEQIMPKLLVLDPSPRDKDAEQLDQSVEVEEDADPSLETEEEFDDAPVDKYAQVVSEAREDNNTVPQCDKNYTTTNKKKKKKRFALFSRRKPKPQQSITLTVPSVEQVVMSKKPLQGILKTPSKSFPIDETVACEDLPPATDGGSTSTVTSHDDDVDPLLDRLKQQQRGLDPGLLEQRQQRLEP